MDGAYAHLAACYKRTTDHCIAELNVCLSPGTWLKSSCRAGRFAFFRNPKLKIQKSQKLCSAVAGLANKINSHKTSVINTKKRLAIQSMSTPLIP
jgi:hypothetical protein